MPPARLCPLPDLPTRMIRMPGSPCRVCMKGNAAGTDAAWAAYYRQRNRQSDFSHEKGVHHVGQFGAKQ